MELTKMEQAVVVLLRDLKKRKPSRSEAVDGLLDGILGTRAAEDATGREEGSHALSGMFSDTFEDLDALVDGGRRPQRTEAETRVVFLEGAMERLQQQCTELMEANMRLAARLKEAQGERGE